MKINDKTLSFTAVVIGVFLLFSLYTVYETDRAIVLRLGKLRQDQHKNPLIINPGLHIKLPFIDDVRKFDTRLNMLDIKSSRIVTNEKKDVLVDFYVEWKIKDLELFYTRTEGNKNKAETLLAQKSIDALRAEFGKSSIKDVVSGARVEVMEKLKKFTDENAANLGISVIDVRIKRIDLPDEVSGAVYARMSSERARVASELKAKGEAEAIVIRANAEQKKRILLANAEQESKHIRGKGDAEAVKIYAKAYEQAPQFFEFYRSLAAYKKVFDNSNNDILVLRPEGEFFKYFNSISNNHFDKK